MRWLLVIAALPLLLVACSAKPNGTPTTTTGGPSTRPSPSTTPVGLPTSSDVDGLAGDWSVTYGAPAVVTISFSGGTYSVIGKTAVRVTGATCSLAPGTLIATFTGSGGRYVGKHGLWWTNSCGFARWATLSATLDAAGRSMVATFAGGTTKFSRVASSPPAFRSSVPTPGQVNLSLAVVLESVALAGGVIVLVPFPGALFNSTLRANYDEITSRLRRASTGTPHHREALGRRAREARRGRRRRLAR